MQIEFDKLYKRGPFYVKPLLRITQESPNGDKRVFYKCLHVYKSGKPKSPQKSVRIAAERLMSV